MDDFKARIDAINPYHSVWVNASAGSGKTKLIIDRIIRLILNGSNPEKILAITFTNAAANEMKERVLNRISNLASITDDELVHQLSQLGISDQIIKYKKILTDLEQQINSQENIFKIQTIHGFCHSLIKQFALETNINPNFKLASNLDSQYILNQVNEEFFKAIANNLELKNAINILSTVTSIDEFNEILKILLNNLDNIEYLFENYNSIDNIFNKLKAFLDITIDISLPSLEQNFITDLFERRLLIISFTQQILNFGNPKEQQKAQAIINFFEQSNFKAFEYIDLLFTQQLTPIKNFLSKATAENYPAILEFIKDEQSKCLNFVKQWRNLRCWHNSKSLLEIANFAIQKFADLKNQNHLLDFNDLIKSAINLLSNPEQQWINYLLYEQIDHILVDEAQDTNPVQWKLILKLFEENFSGNISDLPKTIFIVGDEKQSIYSFQGADNKLYFAIKNYLKAQFANINDKLYQITLTYSFRSRADILNLVDLIANQPANKTALTDNDTNILHQAFHGGPGKLTLWPLIIYKEVSNDLDWPDPLAVTLHPTHEQINAKFIAEQIHGWLNNKRILLNYNRAVEPQDIMILVRNRGVLFYALVKELNLLNIPNSGVDKMILQDHLATKDVISLLNFILYPYDCLNLACLLKSPFIGINEEELLELAANRGALSLWEYLCSLSKFENISIQLEKLLNHEFYHSPHKLLNAILIEQLYYQKFIARLGQESFIIIKKILKIAQEYDDEYGLQRFIDLLQNHPIEVNLCQNNQAVKIMTIHASKGLEANIVIVVDSNKSRTPYSKILWKNDHEPLLFWKEAEKFRPSYLEQVIAQEESNDADEELRLFYVAITRARDELYIAASHNNEKILDQGWYNLFKQAFANFVTSQTNIESFILEKYTQLKTGLTNMQDRYDAYASSHSIASPSKLSNFDIVQSQIMDEQQIIEDDTSNLEAINLGIILHSLMQYGDYHNFDESKILSFVEFFNPQLAEHSTHILEICNKIKLKYYDLLFKNNHKNEYAMSANGQIHRVDKLIFTAEYILIIDYKLSKKVSDESLKAYKTQLFRYQNILKINYPNQLIKTAILWLEQGELDYIVNH